MCESSIEKSKQPDPDEVLAAITSFNDPTIITNIFKELNWTYSFEIREWLMMARQNANLAVKSKALIQLRKLLREAAETSGLIANVSSTIPNPQGGHTTFSAKRIAGVLNPAKQIESTEIEGTQNDKTKETTNESNRGSDRGEGQRPKGGGEIPTGIRDGTSLDTRDTFPSPERCPGAIPNPKRDGGLGGTEPPDGGEVPKQRPGASIGDDNDSEESSNPCIKTQPPTGDRDLFPGISTPAED